MKANRFLEAFVSLILLVGGTSSSLATSVTYEGNQGTSGNEILVGVFKSSFDPVLPGGNAAICSRFAVDQVCNMLPGTAGAIARVAFDTYATSFTDSSGRFSGSFSASGIAGRQLWMVVFPSRGGSREDPVFVTGLRIPDWIASEQPGTINALTLSGANSAMFGSLQNGHVSNFGFLPIPEPSSWILVGLGALLFLWPAFRRTKQIAFVG